MFNSIQMPRAGEPLRASWASNLAARVNELCTASAPGMLQREGLTGTGAAPIRTNLRRRLLAAGGAQTLRAFDMEGGKVVRCRAHAPVKMYTCADYAVSGYNTIYAHLTRSSNTYTLTVNQTSSDESATHAQFVLWEYDLNLKEWVDYRPTIFPVFAL